MDLATRVLRQILSQSKKLVKCAQGGKLQPDVTPGRILFHQTEEIIAKVVRSAFCPRLPLKMLVNVRQRVRISAQGVFGSVALDAEVAQKFGHQRVAPFP